MVGENIEVLVCREALRRGLISRAQLDECLVDTKTPSSVLLSRGFVTPRQLDQLRSDLGRQAAPSAATLLAPAPRPGPEDLPPAAAAAAQAGAKRIGKYQIVAELGRGGMGAVHKAWDGTLRRWVALKILHSLNGPDEVERFRREAQTAATLSHPGIVAVYDIGQEDDAAYIAMEYIQGSTLSGRKLPIAKSCEIMIAVARAVDHAHRRGIIHRDLKPQNIMLDEAKQVRVMDFGLAKPLRGRSQLTVTGTVIGTPSYMPPEQADGHVSQVDHRSDVYSLGAVLYELLTRRPPFEGATVLQTLIHVVERDAPRPSSLNREIPRDLEAVVLRALEKDKTKRYPSAEAFARDLERFLSGKPVEARVPSTADRLKRHLRRHPAAWSASAAGLLALSLLAFLLLRSDPEPGALPAPAARKPAPLPAPAPTPRDRAQPEFDAGQKKLDLARPDLYRKGADLSLMRKALDEAAGHFTKALETFPGHADALFGRAQARALQGRTDDALRDLGRAIEILPGFPAARLARAQILLERIMAFLTSSGWRREEAPPNVRAWTEQAIDDFKKARESGLKGNDLEYAEASLALTEDAAAKAIEILTRVLDTGLRKEEFYKLRGDAWSLTAMKLQPGDAQSDAVTRALRDYTEAIVLRANYHEAFRHRAALYFLLNRPADCLADLQAGIRMNPDDSLALSDLGTYYQRAGQAPTALAHFDRALELDPENFRALNNRSSIKMDRRDYAGARADLERALKISPNHIAGILNLAVCRDALGETEEGIRMVNEVLARLPKFGRAYATRGVLRAHQGKWGPALEDLEKAAEFDPQLYGDSMKSTRDDLRRKAGGK